MSNDLSGLELEVDKPTKVLLLNPKNNLPLVDKDGEQAFVEVHSADSDIARKFNASIRTSRLRMRNPRSLTGEVLEREQIEFLAALTTGWYLVDLSGQPLDFPFSRPNAVELYSNSKLAWLYEQVDAGAGDRGNFSKASSTS